MVCAHHQAMARAGHRVLRDHALASLDVAQQEVLMVDIAKLNLGSKNCLQHGVARGLDIYPDDFIGGDDAKSSLRVGFVSLLAIRQAHGEESYIAPLSSHLFYRSLGQASSDTRIHASANTQHQCLCACGNQVVGKKLYTAFYFVLGIEGRADMQVGDNVALYGALFWS